MTISFLVRAVESLAGFALGLLGVLGLLLGLVWLPVGWPWLVWFPSVFGGDLGGESSVGEVDLDA
jgi:hypothetical protein